MTIKILRDQKEEYLEHLFEVMFEPIIHIFQDIYNTSLKTNPKDVLKQFQQDISKIPEWNQLQVDKAYQTLKCTYLDKLIKTVYVLTIKIIMLGVPVDKRDTLKLKVPSPDNFLHRTLIHMARELWKRPYLFYHLSRSLERQNNLYHCEVMLKKKIKAVIRETIPMDWVVEHLHVSEIQEESSTESEEEDTDSTTSTESDSSHSSQGESESSHSSQGESDSSQGESDSSHSGKSASATESEHSTQEEEICASSSSSSESSQAAQEESECLITPVPESPSDTFPLTPVPQLPNFPNPPPLLEPISENVSSSSSATESEASSSSSEETTHLPIHPLPPPPPQEERKQVFIVEKKRASKPTFF
jgi:hypothetical protein